MYDWLSSTSVKFGQATRLFNFGCSQLRLKLARKDKNEQQQQERDTRRERAHNLNLTQQQRNLEMSEASNLTNNSLQNGRGSIQRQRQRF